MKIRQKKNGILQNFLEMYEIRDFAAMIQGHQNRAFKFTAEESIAVAGVMEEFLVKRIRENKS